MTSETTRSASEASVRLSSDEATTARQALEHLASELARRGWVARPHAPAHRVPSLYVQNPAASILSEHVYAGRGKDGAWWFWWPWPDKIAAVADPGSAATATTHVLRAAAATEPAR